ncbi:hypothetical protein [Marinitoga lauensis]|uniref:hypothetical protein n=1 Tax=Marinitoga lauensis TaxID=2201189 RepID=UPI001F0D0139|nr:hypothetical protein [Marinitoga lauensis]
MQDKLFKNVLIISTSSMLILIIFLLPEVFSGKLILNPVLLTLDLYKSDGMDYL